LRSFESPTSGKVRSSARRDGGAIAIAVRVESSQSAPNSDSSEPVDYRPTALSRESSALSSMSAGDLPSLAPRFDGDRTATGGPGLSQSAYVP